MIVFTLFLNLITAFIFATMLLGGFTYFLEEILPKRKLRKLDWFFIICWGISIFANLARITLGAM